MTNAEQREATRRFINTWKGNGYEKGDTQRFWMSLLSDVLGMDHVADKIEFEKEVVIDGQIKFIDGYIAETRVLIEQKSLGKDLNKAIPQSGDKLLTPYEQAKNYANNLPVDEVSLWIVTCNLEEFHIHDMNKPGAEPGIALLENLQAEIYRFDFLLNKKAENISKEMEISIQAGDLVGDLYDALLKQYKDPTDEESLKSLNALCVRLVFCLYAEDAGIFGRRNMFHDYLMRFEIRDLRKALIELFQVLDTRPEDRDPYMDEELAAFPYVNGGLFSDTNIEIPQMTEEIREIILKKASEDFDWSEISPTIFGAVFESTLNPETRRAGGMHYTSIENIHKVIDPLFLNGLNEELEEIKTIAVAKTKKSRLDEFQKKLAGLSFLDPACGSGNFLTESYVSLRKIENEILKMLMEVEKGQVAGQIMLGDIGSMESPIKVSIGQFYGIEINDFAVTVAKTALWIAESQMMKATEDVIHLNLDFLPLKSYANIVEGNALRMDWNDIVEKDELDYIMGNPPFVGARYQSDEQKSDVINTCRTLGGNEIKRASFLDYVACWYYKASRYVQKTGIECAFVSTNSVTQGEQVEILWNNLLNEFGISINFAYQTFVWNSEATNQAHVHCVIIGFAPTQKQYRYIWDEKGTKKRADHINGYLIDGPDCYIQRLTKPLCNVPKITNGNRAYDGNNLVLTYEEKEMLIKKEPRAEKYIKKYFMGADLLKNEPRYVLWLVNCSPAEMKAMPEIMKRVQAVYEMRSKSKNISTKKAALKPSLFQMIVQPSHSYMAFARVSSQRRRYIPIAFLDADCICGDKLIIVPDGTLYHFGIMISNVHNAWMRVVAGRLKSDYSYSSSVYNNFPWPESTASQKAKIEQTAQGILDARNLYPDRSLVDLYDPLTMPPELRKAHQANDRAVMQAYGFSIKEMSEADCVAELMKMYQALTHNLN